MSSRGWTYLISLQPYSESKLTPLSIRAYSRTGELLDAKADTDIDLGILGVADRVVEHPEILDVRRRSSLVKTRELTRRQSESEQYMDMGAFDGKPYQSHAVLVIRMPSSVREELRASYFNYGIGAITTSQVIMDIVDAHYNSTGNYLLEEMPLAANQILQAREYIDFYGECLRSAERRIRDTIRKYAPLGYYIVVVYK